jgi:ABC-type multidrug transport system ATPase subunit
VLINGINIHENREKVKGLIGYVPQEDLLIEELTVFENLYFNAKLCFDNLPNDEIIRKVEETLANVGLLECRGKKVGTLLNPLISGGQRKRLNIALELIRKPEILFLDEPTSGLSSSDSRNILDLLKDLSEEGKLIFIVIHQPSNEIFRMFDKLIILDSFTSYYTDNKENQGGYMIYCGHPLDAIEHFKRLTNTVNYNENECYACHNVDPDHIFSLVEARKLGKDGQPSASRKTMPDQWNAFFTDTLKKEHITTSLTVTDLPRIDFRIPGKFKQIFIFLWRDIRTKISDSQYIFITLLEAPLLAIILSFLIKYFARDGNGSGYLFMNNKNLPVYLFMSVIVAIFMGMIISADEIFKNRRILKRESFLDLSWNSFLVSKIFVLFIISAIQAFLFVIAGNSVLEIKGMMFKYWLVLFSCWGSSIVTGLLISDSFRSVATIYIIVPLLVIPQILLSGIIVKYDNLNPVVSSPVSIPFYGELITARWGFEALAVGQFVYNRYEEKVYRFDKELSKARYIIGHWCPLLKSKLQAIESDINKGMTDKGFENNLRVLRNELEYGISDFSPNRFDLVGNLAPSRITHQTIISAIDFIEVVKNSCIKGEKEIIRTKDKLIDDNKETFLRLKETYYNTSLAELVKNSKEISDRVIEYKGRLYQKYDQIYQDPAGRSLKAQFYSPTKRFFGILLDTLFFNIIIIWIMTGLLYIALYFRVLRKVLDYFDSHSKK